ncbi:hypothetical protein ACHAW6_011295, partial [Cyclotella cf. meneghiniana]
RAVSGVWYVLIKKRLTPTHQISATIIIICRRVTRCYHIDNMSLLSRAAPRLIPAARRLQNPSMYKTPALVNKRQSSSSKSNLPSNPSKTTEMSREEMYQKLEAANETMKAYYSYPPDKVIQMKKAKFNERHMDNSFFIQLGLASSLVCAFILTPFLGRKIAYDEEFRTKYIPKWFDYTLNKPKNAWTKEELHEQVLMLQKQLHERAIRGEFTPEKLDEMRRNLDKRPEKEEYAHFAKLHPGVDDDEDLED